MLYKINFFNVKWDRELFSFPKVYPILFVILLNKCKQYKWVHYNHPKKYETYFLNAIWDEFSNKFNLKGYIQNEIGFS
jgi:hypothetical protein